MSEHLRNYQMEAEQYRNEVENLKLQVASLKDECWRLRANLRMKDTKTIDTVAMATREIQYKKALEEIAEGHYGEASGKEYPNAWKLAKGALKEQEDD